MFNIKQGSRVELVLDVIASVAIGLMLAVGALAYFDVLVK